MTQFYRTRRGELREKPKDMESWRAPEHQRMASDLRRSRGVKNLDGKTYFIPPGEVILPVATCLKLQRQAEWQAANPDIPLPKHLK